MTTKILFVVSCAVVCCLGQRSPYAGRNPIGFPAIEVETSTNGLESRFNDGNSSTTTETLPLEARGDRDLVNRLSKLPIDQQPFWLINWKALDENRKNPQSYQQNENSFVQRASNVGSLGNPTENRNQMPQNVENEPSTFVNQNDRNIKPTISPPQADSNDFQGMDNSRFIPQNNQRSDRRFMDNPKSNNGMQNTDNPRFYPQNNRGMQVPKIEFGNNRRPFQLNPENTERDFNTQFIPQTNTNLQNNEFMQQDNGMNNVRPQGFQRMPNEWVGNRRFPNANIGGHRRGPTNYQHRNQMNNFNPEFASPSWNRRSYPDLPYEDFKKKE